jgi:hypothetical protein
VIGHEITHGFDDNGRQFDKDGNRKLWWTTETIDRFNKRKTCIVDQYSKYVLEQINTTVINRSNSRVFSFEYSLFFFYYRSMEIKLKVKILLIMVESKKHFMYVE